MGFDFDKAIQKCEAVVADNLGTPGTLITFLGVVHEAVNVIVKTADQVMGEDGNWSGRYAGNLGNGSTETHYVFIPVSVKSDFEKGSCTLANGETYTLVIQAGVDINLAVYAAVKH